MTTTPKTALQPMSITETTEVREYNDRTVTQTTTITTTSKRKDVLVTHEDIMDSIDYWIKFSHRWSNFSIRCATPNQNSNHDCFDAVFVDISTKITNDNRLQLVVSRPFITHRGKLYPCELASMKQKVSQDWTEDRWLTMMRKLQRQINPILRNLANELMGSGLQLDGDEQDILLGDQAIFLEGKAGKFQSDTQHEFVFKLNSPLVLVEQIADEYIGIYTDSTTNPTTIQNSLSIPELVAGSNLENVKFIQKRSLSYVLNHMYGESIGVLTGTHTGTEIDLPQLDGLTDLYIEHRDLCFSDLIYRYANWMFEGGSSKSYADWVVLCETDAPVSDTDQSQVAK